MSALRSLRVLGLISAVSALDEHRLSALRSLRVLGLISAVSTLSLSA